MNRRTTLLLCALLLAACSTSDDRMLTRPDGGPDSDDATGESDTDGAVTDDVDDPRPDEGLSDVREPDFDLQLCRPDNDGAIDREEVPLQAGLAAKFAIASDVMFDTAGAMEGDELVWDLSGEFPGERRDLLELRDPSGTWWETTFPQATYYTELAGGGDFLGVFELTDDAVLLLGVVSEEDGFSKTELSYDPPVPVLQFPLRAGDSWQVDADVSGTYVGVFSFYTESYVFEADAVGELRTPFGNFDVTRVRSTLDRQVGLLQTVIRSFGFVSECFGTVATITSQENEGSAEFTDVADVRRLAP